MLMYFFRLKMVVTNVKVMHVTDSLALILQRHKQLVSPVFSIFNHLEVGSSLTLVIGRKTFSEVIPVCAFKNNDTDTYITIELQDEVNMIYHIGTATPNYSTGCQAVFWDTQGLKYKRCVLLCQSKVFDMCTVCCFDDGTLMNIQLSKLIPYCTDTEQHPALGLQLYPTRSQCLDLQKSIGCTVLSRSDSEIVLEVDDTEDKMVCRPWFAISPEISSASTLLMEYSQSSKVRKRKLKPGDQVIYLSPAVHLNEAYVIQAEDYTRRRSLLRSLNLKNYLVRSGLSHNPEVGLLVACQYDGVFQRAQVMKFDSDSKLTTIFLIDEGKIIEEKWKNLLPMPSKFMQEPGFAIKCKLSDVPVVDSTLFSGGTDIIMQVYKEYIVDINELNLVRLMDESGNDVNLMLRTLWEFEVEYIRKLKDKFSKLAVGVADVVLLTNSSSPLFYVSTTPLLDRLELLTF